MSVSLSFRGADYIHELVPMDAGKIESMTMWDFSKLSAIDDHSKAYGNIVGNVMYIDVDGQCRAFLLKGDSLLYRGYNSGRLERMLLEKVLRSIFQPWNAVTPYIPTSTGMVMQT